MATKRLGKIIIPHGLRPEEHELATADIFTAVGKDVEFLVPSRNKNSRTPDVIIDGVAWELKSPTGKSKTTIANTLKRAVRQSGYIIFDARRTKLPDVTIESEIRRNLILTKSIVVVRLVTKLSTVIDIRKQ